MAPSVAPPTPQEIQRKLSVHSASRVKPSTTSTFAGPSPSNINNTLAPGTSGISTSWGTAGLISGTESDSDSILTPDIASSHAGFSLPSASFMQPPLSSIAERSPGSGGEDSDEDDDDGAGWRVVTDGTKTAAMSGVGGQTSAADVAFKSGYLSKKGERRKTWKKRWFVLRRTHLAFYKTDAEYKLLRLLDLNDVHSCVPVTLKRHSNVFGLILPKRTYYLQAASARDVQDWVEAIEDARQTLMATSTQTSGNNGSVSTPIPIPQNPTTGTYLTSRPLPISISHHQQSPNTAQVVSSSDSEDTMSQLAPPPIGGPPPLGGGGGGGDGGADRGGGGLVAPSPTNVTFAPVMNKPQVLPASPPLKDVSTSTSKIILSGYLMKCGSKRRNWRKRWFVLTAEKLLYSRSHMDTKPHRIFAFTDILDAMDYDLPKHRSHYHYHHHTTGLTPSLSTSSPPSTVESVLGTSVGTASSLTASPASVPAAAGSNVHADLGTETQQEGRNFTFKIVTTKRNLLLCAPSEEDEIKWLGAVRALISRRTASGPVGTLQQQQQGLSSSTPAAEGAGGSGTPGTGGGGGGGGGLKSKVRRLSASAGVLGVGGGKSNTTNIVSVGGGAPTTTTFTVIGAAGVAGDETRDAH